MEKRNFFCCLSASTARCCCFGDHQSVKLLIKTKYIVFKMRAIFNSQSLRGKVDRGRRGAAASFHIIARSPINALIVSVHEIK